MATVVTVTEYQLASFIDEKTYEGVTVKSVTPAGWRRDRDVYTVVSWKVLLEDAK